MNTRILLIAMKKPFTCGEQKSMTNKIDWKQEVLDSAKFNKKQENLLKHATKSLTDSWLLGVLYTRWKKLKGIREKPISNCSSTFQEWNKIVEKVDKCV